MSHRATLPPTILTPAQRAARVTAAFYQRKTMHLSEVMRLTQLNRRSALNLLDALSGCGGIPITDVGGDRWVLVERDHLHGKPAMRPKFDIHPDTRALIAFALGHDGQARLEDLAEHAGLTVTEVRWLLERLRVGGLPIDEMAGDTWSVRRGR